MTGDDAPRAPAPTAAAGGLGSPVTASPAARPGAADGGAQRDGAVRFIPIQTDQGVFRVWTRRLGDNPRLKVLLLHGGPGATHEYFESFDPVVPAAGIECYYYDQLGSHYSDQPDEPGLWEIPRFVDEVEQVRLALGLDADNFVLLGHSWGGILALEYALVYQQHLKGLVISNMMASVPAYNLYARRVLMPTMDPQVLADIQAYEAAGQYDHPRYLSLLVAHHYEHHVLRMPYARWPDPVRRAFRHLNAKIYVPLQGPSELGASGKIEHWDRMADLCRVQVPSLVIGATHDTMDPEHLRWMGQTLPRGRYVHCPEGSHMPFYDDPQPYFSGLIQFLRELQQDHVRPPGLP